MVSAMLSLLFKISSVAILYYLSAKAVSMLSLVESGSVFAIWPPTGIALAALLIFGYRIWPGILIGALALNLTLTPLLPSLQIAITNTIGPLTGFWFLSRYCDKKLFTSLKSMLLFFTSILIASTITSVGGASTLLLYGFITSQLFAHVCLSWFLGDLIGFLLITPFILSFSLKLNSSKNIFSIEGMLMLILLITMSLILFGPLELFDTIKYPVVYFLLLPLIWGVLRCSIQVSVSSILFVAIVSIYGTTLGFGPFLRSDPNESLILLQSFIGYMSALILLMIAIFREREHSLENAINLTITQNELLQKNRWYKEIFEISPVGIALNKMSGEFIDCNSALHNMCGYTKEEFIHLSYWDVTPIEYEEQETAQLKSLNLTGKYGPYEKEYIHKDGHRIPVLLNGVKSVDDDGEEYIWSVIQDMSAQKLIEENLRTEKEKAESANRSKSQFLANMSHEIRTPLNGILGFVDLLCKDETDIKRKEQCVYIKSSGSTLLAIINDILDFSKIENGKLEIENALFMSKDLFDAVANIYSELSQTKGIKFTYTISPSLPHALIGDILRIKQVLLNLLSNALKFTSSGGEINLYLDYNTETKRLSCKVKDSGVGIQSKNLNKIFHAFEQEDVSTTRKYGGTGLGLAISSRLIEMMGGELRVESVVGKGSTFSFDLIIEEGIETKPSQESSKDDGEMHFHAHALIVEDNKTNQALLGIFLDDFGMTFDLANDGLEALSLYEKGSYDVVLMDENMPNMNGIEATQKIRALEESKSLKHTPIIAVTANALTGDRGRFIEAGMDDYISKPYTEDDIQKVLAKYLTPS